ncbi:1,5-anhydro-D-fructose reductase-like isoform X1 [Dermacentor silvarum]|uniref:1,5-anhydro-D-fructose reductase-like isoform X1 n=1 Tax=Dermacentor silvarum TaxID=543639 RepID=UPI0021009E37|nr:1,5-anhydro-D-fructose reductase-like isoform X1 [Dermacentor silvarum]
MSSSSVESRPKEHDRNADDAVRQPINSSRHEPQQPCAENPKVAEPAHALCVDRFRRHCVLMNNGVWMPLVGIGICKGDSAMVERVVEAAVAAGYRYIDTSHAAHNEAAIGNALRRVIAAGKVRREELFVVTKLPCEGNRRDKVRKYLRSSLKKLQMPFVDLYMVHFPVYERAFKKSHRRHGDAHQQSDLPDVDASPDSPTSEEESATPAAVDETDILDTWRGMEDAANMGMTRSIGLCNFNKEQVTRILAMATIRPAALQVECHAYMNQDDLLQFCKERSICLTAYAPLGSPVGAMHVAACSKEQKPREEQNHSDLMQHAVLRKMADTYKKTPAQILIRWLLQRGVVALPRSTCPDHIQENIQVFDFELSETDVKTLTGLNRNMRLFAYNIYGLPDRAEYPFK